MDVKILIKAFESLEICAVLKLVVKALDFVDYSVKRSFVVVVTVFVRKRL